MKVWIQRRFKSLLGSDWTDYPRGVGISTPCSLWRMQSRSKVAVHARSCLGRNLRRCPQQMCSERPCRSLPSTTSVGRDCSPATAQSSTTSMGWDRSPATVQPNTTSVGRDRSPATVQSSTTSVGRDCSPATLQPSPQPISASLQGDCCSPFVLFIAYWQVLFCIMKE